MATISLPSFPRLPNFDRRSCSFRILGLLAGFLAAAPVGLSAQSLSLAGPSPSVNFGSVNLCGAGQTSPAPCSETLTLTYNVTAGGTLGTPRVVTSGAANLDFNQASGTTCTGRVAAGSTCKVRVIFAPRFAGTRPGAVQITDGSGNVLATTPIYGFGVSVSPQIGFLPSPTVLVPPFPFGYDPPGPTNFPIESFGSYNSVAVNGAGDVFFTNGNAVQELAGGQGPPVSIGSGWSNPSGLAVDGAGDLFVADSFNHRLVEIPAGGGTPSTIPIALQNPHAIAVSAAGDLYIADFAGLGGSSAVWKIAAGNGAQSVVYSAPAGAVLDGQIAVDYDGNLFVSLSVTDNSGNGSQTVSVVEVPAGNGAPSAVFSDQATPLSTEYPYNYQALGSLGVAEDPAGSLIVGSYLTTLSEYYTDEGTQYTLGQTQSFISIHSGSDTLIFSAYRGAGWSDGTDYPYQGVGPVQFAVDAGGDLFYADGFFENVSVIDRYQPPALNFGTVPLGSLGIQSLTVSNTGVGTLVVVPSFNNPEYAILKTVPGNCLAGMTAGQNCTLTIGVSPSGTGPANGVLLLTTNGLRSPSIQLTAAATGVNAPVLSLPSGVYSGTQSLTITDTTPGAKIYYTTDGTAPTAQSKHYSAPIPVKSTEKLSAIAIGGGSSSLAVAASYIISPAQPAEAINFSEGFAETSGSMQLNGSADLDGARLQLTKAVMNQAASAFYTTPVNIQAFTTVFTFQLTSPSADGFTFAIQNAGPDAVGRHGEALGYATIPKSVAIKFDLHDNAGEGEDSTGIYVDGALPTTPAIDLSVTGIDFHSGNDILAQITYDGTNLTVTLTDIVTLATWSHSYPIDIPATVGGDAAYIGFTAGTGLFSAEQEILSWTYVSGTPGAAAPLLAQALPEFAGGFLRSGFSAAGLILNGSASLSPASEYGTDLTFSPTLQLTDGGKSEAGSAFYAVPLNIQKFSTDFTFQFLKNPVANGITFTMQSVGPRAIGGEGDALGYATIARSVALKFDLYSSGKGFNSTGVYTDGALPVSPEIDLTSLGFPIDNGISLYEARIVYDGVNLNLTLIDDFGVNPTITQSFPVDIPSAVGGNTAYVGFTGSTGARTALQQVTSWTFTNP